MLSKRNRNLIFGSIILLFSIAALFFSGPSSKNSQPFKNDSITPTPDVYDEEVLGQSLLPSLAPNISPVIEEDIIEDEIIQVPVEQVGYRVVKVVDGDTLDVDIDGKVERLRLIGIDTPETVDPRKSVQCFGIEASNKAKELLVSQYVTLESDETQGERDKYKRLLRYVFLSDGTNFNLYMIAEGYANEYTYDQVYKYQSEFKQAQINARNQNKGLWSADTCSGNK